MREEAMRSPRFPRLLVFAGTTEGRELAEYLERQGIAADICVATEYGETLIDQGTSIHRIHAGRLGMEAMAALMGEMSITHVVDATHPYAVEVSRNIREAADQAGVRYLRLLRESSALSSEVMQEKLGAGQDEVPQNPVPQKPVSQSAALQNAVSPNAVLPNTVLQNAAQQDTCAAIIEVASVSEAVAFLQSHPGNVLAATGSKELQLYTQIPDYQNRVFARILSTKESMETASALGFQGKNLICMQGPFSEELNIAMLRSVNAAYMVTKESGKTGGFPEKLRAAKKAGASLIVVGRPPQEEGYSFAEMTEELDKIFAGLHRHGIRVYIESSESTESLQSVENAENSESIESLQRRVTLIGIGMGAPEGMTLEAARAIREADLLIGAERMLESARELLRETTGHLGADKQTYCAYLSDEITNYIREHREFKAICILLSGDIGFYSGARKLIDKLERIDGLAVETVSGISSVVYLCGKLRTAWEDVKLVSLHGRSQNLISAVARYPKVFALVGKKDTFRSMCEELIEYGFGDVRVSAGSNLSYENERIMSGMMPEQIVAEDFVPDDLCSVLIENARAVNIVTHGIEDEAFIRGKVPMTKSEVRSISLSKLYLRSDSVLYDIGAGTGSVSIEAARMACDGMVYAIEKKAEAVSLIRENMRHFGVSNIEVIEGLAPEALEDLPAPTHAFLGGTSGNMRSILDLLLAKNPQVRIVINAIALETVAETLKVLRELGIKDADIACVNVSKSKEVGSYHMMMGLNPVYIISFGGER